MAKYFYILIIFIFLISCNSTQNIKNIKKNSSNLKVTTGGVEAKID